MKALILFLTMMILPYMVTTSQPDTINIITELPEIKVEKVVQVTPSKRIKLTPYIEKMAYLESRGRYKIVNNSGHLGRYQFNKRTLKGLGFTQDDISNFLDNETLQDSAMVLLIKHNQKIIKNYGLEKYIDKTIGGVKITIEGMLAAAHLVGPYALKHFIMSGGSLEPVEAKTPNGDYVTIKKYDGNGTSIIDYMKHFDSTDNTLES